jgi:DNA-binding NarL/FixJ family response regulator
MPSNVLIVDDHPGFRASARRLLTSHGYEVVGEAASGEEALEAVRSLEPELVLLDVGLPDADGIEVARRIRERHPDARVVLVSSRDRDEVEPLLDGAGAEGFIPKAELSASALRDLLD